MADLPRSFTNIWLRSFYGFGPEEDGYIGWTKVAGRDHMLNKMQSGDLIMVYGAGTSETRASERLRILGFLQVDAVPIRDVDKASEVGMRRKQDNDWLGQWSYALPVRRAWRADESILLERIAPTTYRPEAGQAIAAWSPALEPAEIEAALKIKVTEVSVFGEPPISVPGLQKAPLGNAFKPSRAFAGSFGERTANYEDGPTPLYLACFAGDGFALLGRAKSPMDKSLLLKIGVSNAPKRRLEELNAGFPPAAIGKWAIKLLSEPYADREAAESAEQIFKDRSEGKLESLGGEFFFGDWTAAEGLFASIPGVSRFGGR